MRDIRYFKIVWDGETRTVYRFERSEKGIFGERFDPQDNAWVDHPNLIKNMFGLGHSDFEPISREEAREFVENVEHGTFAHPHDAEEADAPATSPREVNEEDPAIPLTENQQTESRFCGIYEKIGHEPVTDEERERLKRITQAMREQEKTEKKSQ